ncbi:MAG TPA: class I SAM-dependent methyltransferase [Patescibacteria group bacterium]|jgi:hypothetical protein|nr:class I SAM-dependent methyltransferase [Patescibacteria group bacterium]
MANDTIYVMINSNLLHQWKIDEKAHFEGWDFSYLKSRFKEKKPNWDYISLAKPLVQQATSLLDMATGGGEVFSQLAPFPKHTYAIEGWHPNVALAKKRLAQLGVTVIEADGAHRLPFKDSEFDLVVNRHGGYNVDQLKRIIRSQGQFFTQQVGGDNLKDLEEFFDNRPKWPFNTLEHRIPEFEKHGFTIINSKKWSGIVTFFDVGAIIYFLKAIPWIVNDFSVNTHLPYLEKMQKKLDKGEKLQFIYTRHLIHAKRN